MDTAVNIWNLLWDAQIYIAVFFVFIIWIVVRGSDLIRWLFRKLGLSARIKRMNHTDPDEDSLDI